MRYGKIRIEDGNLIFLRHMIQNNLPCRDIVWAYIHREGENAEAAVKQMISNYLVIITRRKKRYRFEMTEHEAQDCLRLLKILNPDMATGFPRGGRLPLLNLPNTRDLGALATKDGRHILPRRLFRSGNLYHASLAGSEPVFAGGLSQAEDCDRPSGTRRRQKEKPDAVMKGVEYYHIPMIDEETVADIAGKYPWHFTGEAQGFARSWNMTGTLRALIGQQYENFVKDQYSVKQCARFMDVLAAS